MFQFPLLTNLLSSDLKSLQGTQGPNNGLLDGLFGDGDVALTDFASELQSLLMSWDPQMAKRLDELLGGGMSLPQAARSLLSSGTGQMPTLAGELTLGSNVIGPANADEALSGKATDIGKLLGAVAQLQRSGADSASPTAPPVGTHFGGTMPLPAQLQPFAPQLTANLLDMGVPQAVTDKGWGQAIADRVVWMVQGDQQSARLKLNPPNLGPLEVRVAVTQDQASVSFIAQHAVVREALEAAMPRLREMFDQQSLNLVHTDVSDSHAEHGASAQGFGRSSADGQLTDDDPSLEQSDPSADAAVVDIGSGLVDLFA